MKVSANKLENFSKQKYFVENINFSKWLRKENKSYQDELKIKTLCLSKIYNRVLGYFKATIILISEK